MTPDEFWYIKLRDYGDRGDQKKPAEAWGGFGEEFETNDNVYTHEETQSMDHSNFAIVGHRSDDELVVIDADCHKIDDFDPDALLRPTTGVPVVKSTKPGRDVPGFHFYTLVNGESYKGRSPTVKGAQPYIDIKANSKGHVVSPWHNDSYTLVAREEMRIFADVKELNAGFEYDGTDIITSRTQYTTEWDGDGEWRGLPDNETMPACLENALKMRQNIPRDGSYPNPWQLDSVVGRRLVAFGYSKEKAMELLEEHPPQDGYDERETAYQMDRLFQKELYPDSIDTLRELGIMGDDERCTCRFCGCDFSDDLIARDPKSYREWSA